MCRTSQAPSWYQRSSFQSLRRSGGESAPPTAPRAAPASSPRGCWNTTNPSAPPKPAPGSKAVSAAKCPTGSTVTSRQSMWKLTR